MASAYMTINMRAYLSMNHMCAAALFSRQAWQIEQAHTGIYQPDIFMDHRSYVIGAIFAAVAFLEACINELFADAGDPNGLTTQYLATLPVVLMERAWNNPNTESLPILDKFDVALGLAGQPCMDRSRFPGQDVAIVIALRNALMHYKPVWQPATNPHITLNDIIKLARKLKHRVTDNPLAGAGNAYYPDKVLSYSCADWATNSALALADAFFAKLGVVAPYAHLRQNFKTR